MLKFVYVILLSCLLGYFTSQLSQEKLPAISANPISEIALPDSGLTSTKKLSSFQTLNAKETENLDIEESEEIYYESGDLSMMMLHAISQFVWKWYE